MSRENSFCISIAAFRSFIQTFEGGSSPLCTTAISCRAKSASRPTSSSNVSSAPSSTPTISSISPLFLGSRQFEDCTTVVLALTWYGPDYDICTMQPTALSFEEAALTSACPPSRELSPLPHQQQQPDEPSQKPQAAQNPIQVPAPAQKRDNSGNNTTGFVVGVTVGSIVFFILCVFIWTWGKHRNSPDRLRREAEERRSRRNRNRGLPHSQTQTGTQTQSNSSGNESWVTAPEEPPNHEGGRGDRGNVRLIEVRWCVMM